MVQETPVPDVHAGEDYVAHHHHGLRTLARLMTLSFIDVDSARRTFRFYGVQAGGGSRGGAAAARGRVRVSVCSRLWLCWG
jgi:hypothetical protein